jgi:acetyl esterase/lipase
MSVSFSCPCGRRYSVGDHLAGKTVRCKQCGSKQRIPSPSAPDTEIDVYGLDAPPPLAPAAPEPDEPGVAPGPRTAAKHGKRPKSRGAKALRGFLESLPRGEDLHYPVVGVVALVATFVLPLFGVFIAKVYVLFVVIAAVACFVWACASGLLVASGQGFLSALTLSPALIATAVFYYTLMVPNPTPKGPLVASAMAAACFAAFFLEEKRGKEYRRPISVGVLATLLVVSFSLMLNIARHNIASGTIPRSVEQEAAVPLPPPPGRQASPPSNPATEDTVARALATKGTLNEARSGFRPKPFRPATAREPLETPPPGLFETVRYDSAAGPLAAYLTPNPGDGRRHPAVIWLTGGDTNTIGDVWTPRDPANDQSAGAYRKAGIVMMFPSLRGGNENPGRKESFLGEVDDVLAAADFLARQDYVDPERIYLGGHSTGGTLALLVAESTSRFRAVFSFGPANDIRGYGPEYNPFDASDFREVFVRSPGYWLHSIRCPTFVFEGERGNIDALRAMQGDSSNPLVHFYAVTGADHFNILDPTNRRIAAGILRDDGPSTNLAFTPGELNQPFGR